LAAINPGTAEPNQRQDCHLIRLVLYTSIRNGRGTEEREAVIENGVLLLYQRFCLELYIHISLSKRRISITENGRRFAEVVCAPIEKTEKALVLKLAKNPVCLL
jgi:hypothetical protein